METTETLREGEGPSCAEKQHPSDNTLVKRMGGINLFFSCWFSEASPWGFRSFRRGCRVSLGTLCGRESVGGNYTDGQSQNVPLIEFEFTLDCPKFMPLLRDNLGLNNMKRKMDGEREDENRNFVEESESRRREEEELGGEGREE